jgi:hypothetical protein
MAGITREIWASARYLYAVESLGKERGAGTGFSALQAEGLLGIEVLSLDSTAVKVHPDAHGASKKTGSRR